MKREKEKTDYNLFFFFFSLKKLSWVEVLSNIKARMRLNRGACQEPSRRLKKPSITSHACSTSLFPPHPERLLSGMVYLGEQMIQGYLCTQVNLIYIYIRLITQLGHYNLPNFALLSLELHELQKLNYIIPWHTLRGVPKKKKKN